MTDDNPFDDITERLSAQMAEQEEAQAVYQLSFALLAKRTLRIITQASLMQAIVESFLETAPIYAVSSYSWMVEEPFLSRFLAVYALGYLAGMEAKEDED